MVDISLLLLINAKESKYHIFAKSNLRFPVTLSLLIALVICAVFYDWS